LTKKSLLLENYYGRRKIAVAVMWMTRELYDIRISLILRGFTRRRRSMLSDCGMLLLHGVLMLALMKTLLTRNVT
jgi:hypothetical protein